MAKFFIQGLNLMEKRFMPEHEQWLLYAELDLKAAKRLVNDDEEPLVPPALVHAQQCAEKALKAYLKYCQVTIIKTHDLIKLTEACMQFDPEFESLLQDALDLNPHVTVSRYPDSRYMMLDLTTAKLLIQKSERIFKLVESKF